MSNILRKRRPTVSGAQTEPSSSKKQRLIDGTNALLDIAKESADAFAPLKSCLGGVCALIKHYEEYKDVEDKVRDLIPWLNRLKGSVATACVDDNPEDAERREQLTRSLKDIEERSLVYLGKGKAARIFDKKRDSGMVVKLVEELRQAILIYQLSQQRSIDNQVTQLTTSFSAFLKLREKPQGIQKKVERALERLGRLDVEGNTIGDRGESKRRMVLFEALEGIKDELLPLLERSSAVGYKENDADACVVCELTEDVRDAITEYQLAQQKAIYDQSCRLIDSDEWTVLNSSRRARGAGYQHGNRNGCLKGTRESVLDEIERWSEDSEKSPVFWLNGLAGTGKTTIAQTIAERVFAEGRLGASFFCSRDFEDRSDLHFIFPTLAFQLAHKFPEFRSHFVSLLRTNSDVVYESLYNQMQKLIAEPLRTAGISTVIVIDALDECKDDEPSSAILSVLGRFVGQVYGTKFFITGRPEPRIRTGFRLPLLIDSTDVFVLHDVHPSLVNSDILLYLKHELSELAQRRQLEGWPTEENIDVLCHRAAGLFVYAVATVKFLDSNTHLPKRRLDAILKLPECTAPEGKTRFKPKTTLDSLYASILQAAFSEEDPDVDLNARAIVGTVVMVVNPLPPPAIAELIGLELEEVTLFLTLIQSLLAMGDDSNHPVKPFHKSFPDFITDPSRCPNSRFLVSPGHLHHQLATNCLRLMNDELKQNLLSLPEYALNSQVADLQSRIDDRISIALRYACRSWHSHLVEIKENTIGVISYLRTFLEEKFLAWLEVLSILGDVGEAAVALEKLITWLQELSREHELLDTTRDYFRFATKFFEPINASATHIYHSALELCPTSSIVRKFYYKGTGRITRLPRVLVGNPDSWDPTMSISGKGDYLSCTWSPCGRFVAASTGNIVEIRNQLTFELLTTLQPAENTPPLVGSLAYSPDGRSLSCATGTAIIVWDIQTGGMAKEIVCGVNAMSLVWSSDGSTICTLHYIHQHTRHIIALVHTYDVSSGTPLLADMVTSIHKPCVWAYKKNNFGVMTTRQHPLDCAKIEIKILQIEGFDVKYRPVKTHTSSSTVKTQSEDAGTECTPESDTISFSPTTCHISALVDNELLIWDCSSNPLVEKKDLDFSSKEKDPEPLLKEKGRFISPCFSSDGTLFAASEDNDVCIWGYNFGHYVRWRQFRCQGGINSPQFSPTSPSFLSHSKNIIQMWHSTDLPTVPEPRRRQHAVLSHSGSHIAITDELASTIAIINPYSQFLPQQIDAGVRVEGLFLTRNVLLVIGLGQLVAWLLTEDGPMGGAVDDRMLKLSDCLWSIPLNSPHDIIRATLLPRPGPKLRLHVEGQIGVIECDGVDHLLYHTTTGEILNSVQTPPQFDGPGLDLVGRFCGRHHLYCHNLPQHNTPPESSWYPSETALQEGWVKDPEGRYRLWLHVEWRTPGAWDRADWRHDITTQFGMVGDQPLIIKF